MHHAQTQLREIGTYAIGHPHENVRIDGGVSTGSDLHCRFGMGTERHQQNRRYSGSQTASSPPGTQTIISPSSARTCHAS